MQCCNECLFGWAVGIASGVESSSFFVVLYCIQSRLFNQFATSVTFMFERGP